jgi:hypothetical protein
VSREHSLLALGMGRIFTVFFVILVKKCALGDEAGELRSGELSLKHHVRCLGIRV